MTIFHDKLGNRLAMTETDALALGYTYKHKGLKMSEKVNQECSSTKANELADKLETEDCCTLDMEAVADMLRQQQAELDRAVELYTDKAIENEALLKFIDERGETGQLIIWKAQEK